MVRGVNANRLSLDTVGHNITNASTEGYSRQSVNLSATTAQEYYSAYGAQLVGTGVDSLSITRARNIYADKQYWKENGEKGYYDTRQTDYDKIEAIFNDSTKTGIQNAMEKFYQSWVDLSTTASNTSSRTNVVENGKVFADRLKTATGQLQQQIQANYDDLDANVTKVNQLTDQIVELNKNIMSLESTGSNANDLRDKRDLLTDELAGYVNIDVYEESNGMYTVVSNGASLVSGINKLTVGLSAPKPNETYGVTDRGLIIVDTGTVYMPTTGKLKANQDCIAANKEYIDDITNMASFMLTTFNDQHKAGFGMKGNAIDPAKTNINFYGETGETFTMQYDANGNFDGRIQLSNGSMVSGVQIIDMLTVNSVITQPDGTAYIAACGGTAANPNGTADGSNATLLSTLFNMTQDNTVDTTTVRSIGKTSLNGYYHAVMTELGVNANSVDNDVTAQDQIVTQVQNWRDSTSGVNWNEELTHMITFQQGFAACSRCLTTMDEMLDKLINGTGTVGR